MLKKKQLQFIIGLLISIGVLTLVSIAANILLLQQNKDIVEKQRVTEEKLRLLEAGQDELVLQIDFVADAANASRAGLVALRAETALQLEDAQSALDEAQDALRDEITEELQDNNDRITNIVDEWSGALALVRCDGSRGSGALFMIGNQLQLVTNRHVLTDKDDIFAEECNVEFPSSDIASFDFTEADLIFDSEDSDFAALAVPYSASAWSEARKGETWCKATPQTGDQIAVLGYPAIGAKESVTVTEGIISGYDDGYFISSAKVDQGNSGGAAIWVEQNCYLGIPTKVLAGVAETLARILDIQTVEF